MASRLGELEVSLSANISRFIKALDEAEARTQKRMAAITRTLKRAATSFATVFSVAAVGAFVKSTLNVADALAKLSAQTGFTVKELQRYQFAAGQLGVSQDKFNTGIQAFAKRIGELKAGTGGLFTFLNKYDKQLLNTLKTSNSTGQAFRILAGRFGEIEDATLRAGLGAAAFSRSAGIELAGGLRVGVRELERLGDEIERSGGLLDDKQTKASERANDALELLGATIRTVAQSIVVDLAPAIEAAVGLIRGTFIPVTASIAIVFNTVRAAIAQTVAFVIEKYADLQALFREIPGVDKFLPGIKASEEALRDFAFSVRNVADDAMLSITDRIEQLLSGSTKLAVQIKDTTDDTDDFGDSVEDAAESIKKAIEPTKKWADALSEVDEELSKLPEALVARDVEAFKDEIARMAVETEVLTAKIELLDRAMFNEIITTDQHTRALERLTGATAEAEKETEQFGDTVVEITRSIKDRIQDAFVGLYEDIFGGKALSSVKNFLEAIKRAFIRTIAEIAAKWTAAKIFGAVSGVGSLASIFGGGGKSGGGGIAAALNIASIAKGGKALIGKVGGFLGFGGAGGATATALPAAAVPSGAVAGTLGPIFVGAPVGAGVAGAAGAFGAGSAAAALDAAAVATSGAAAGSLGASLAAAAPYAAAIIGAALIAKKIFGGGRSPQEIFRDEMKQVQSDLASGASKAFQLGDFRVVGGGLSSVFAEDPSNRLADIAKSAGLNAFSEGGITRITGLKQGAVELEQIIADAVQRGLDKGFSLESVNTEIGELTGVFDNASRDWVALFERGAQEVGGSFEVVGNQSGELTARLKGDIEAWTQFLARETGFSSQQAREALRRLIQEGAVGFDVLRGSIGSVAGELGVAAGAALDLSNRLRSIPPVPGIPSAPAPQNLGGFANGGTFTVPGTGNRDRGYLIGLTPGEVFTVRDKGSQSTLEAMSADIRGLRRDLRRLQLERGGLRGGR